MFAAGAQLVGDLDDERPGTRKAGDAAEGRELGTRAGVLPVRKISPGRPPQGR